MAVFRFRETIKARENYKIYKTDYLLEKTKDDQNNQTFYTYLLMHTTDFTNVVVLDGGMFVMTAQLKSFEEFKEDYLEGGNDAAELVEMFITKKGNKYIYWRDNAADEDYITKYEDQTAYLLD